MKCTTLTVLCCIVIGGYAEAVDRPPEIPGAQRSWLCENLCRDMDSIPAMFAKQEYASVRALNNKKPNPKWAVGDYEVALLADYYYRTRAQRRPMRKSCSRNG